MRHRASLPRLSARPRARRKRQSSRCCLSPHQTPARIAQVTSATARLANTGIQSGSRISGRISLAIEPRIDATCWRTTSAGRVCRPFACRHSSIARPTRSIRSPATSDFGCEGSWRACSGPDLSGTACTTSIDGEPSGFCLPVERSRSLGTGEHFKVVTELVT
jgi:hypothetical protein